MLIALAICCVFAAGFAAGTWWKSPFPGRQRSLVAWGKSESMWEDKSDRL
jgi:hypothetical protein